MMIQQEAPEAAKLGHDELARRCREDIKHYQQDGRSNAHSANGMELFRRAVELHDENAWRHIYDLFRGVVITWAKAFAGTDGMVRCEHDEQDELVNTAFGRFSCAFTEAHLAGCDSLSAILQYLKFVVRSTVFDEKRRRQVRRGETSLDAIEEEHGPFSVEDANRATEIAQQVIGGVWAQDLWQAILEELSYEDERTLLTLLYVQELKPAQIWHQYPWWFSTLEDVINMQRRIRTRLLKNPRIQYFLSAYRGDDATPARPVVPSYQEPVPAVAQVQGKKRRAPRTRPIPQAAELVQDTPAGTAEDQSPPFAADAPMALPRPAPSALPLNAAPAPAPNAPPASASDGRQKKPQKARPAPSASPHQTARVPVIHYRLQKSFCGKARCIRCRNGQGHGPYWYAYFTVDGKTVRRYVGKTLPSSLQVHAEVAPSDYAR